MPCSRAWRPARRFGRHRARCAQLRCYPCRRRWASQPMGRAQPARCTTRRRSVCRVSVSLLRSPHCSDRQVRLRRHRQRQPTSGQVDLRTTDASATTTSCVQARELNPASEQLSGCSGGPGTPRGCRNVATRVWGVMEDSKEVRCGLHRQLRQKSSRNSRSELLAQYKSSERRRRQPKGRRRLHFGLAEFSSIK